MEHTKGYCECGYYHKRNEAPPTTPLASSVSDLLEYDPITGKPALNTAGISPSDIQKLLFTDGQEVWDMLEEPEKTLFANFVRERYLQARISKGETVAQKFYGNMLININLGLPVMHGEYTQ